MPAEHNIVIVGGGFAGTTLARSLQRQLPQGWRVVLVSEESYTTFNPMLAEVVGASVFPESSAVDSRASRWPAHWPTSCGAPPATTRGSRRRNCK